MLFPDTIRTIGVIAPAGRLAPELAESGRTVLRREGLKVKGPLAVSECGVSYLAGLPEERAAALEKMWLDPAVDLLLCTRGGFGSAQLLPLLDWKTLRKRRIPLCGYSDVTALHWAMMRMNAGLPVVCPMLGKLAAADGSTLDNMKKAFAGEKRSCPVRLIAGEGFAGKILAGNLTVAASLAGSDFLPDAAGRVILLEDINEPVYKIDRCLTQLEQSGLFSGAAGVVFGAFSGSDPEELEKFFRRFAARTGRPVAAGFPFGHSFPLMSFSFDDVLTVADGTAVLRR
ncbi:MAG: LD-carboxypeptidase [Lentisphaeria bacterium]|nr:LD-carboxypeptidase [Lentisphaeria bacterium]